MPDNMIIRCSVCRLDPERRRAVEAALTAAVPLGEISRSCGLSKSALSRHSRHSGRPESVASNKTPAAIVVRTAAPVPASEPAAPAPTKTELLRRVEILWSEALDGLEASKEPIVLSKPDGSKLEISGGDLRARAAFVRAGRDVVQLSAELSGELAGQSIAINNVILVPMIEVLEKESEPVTVNVTSK